jgi:hypothetical protein
MLPYNPGGHAAFQDTFVSLFLKFYPDPFVFPDTGQPPDVENRRKTVLQACLTSVFVRFSTPRELGTRLNFLITLQLPFPTHCQTHGPWPYPGPG